MNVLILLGLAITGVGFFLKKDKKSLTLDENASIKANSSNAKPVPTDKNESKSDKNPANTADNLDISDDIS